MLSALTVSPYRGFCAGTTTALKGRASPQVRMPPPKMATSEAMRLRSLTAESASPPPLMVCCGPNHTLGSSITTVPRQTTLCWKTAVLVSSWIRIRMQQYLQSGRWRALLLCMVLLTASESLTPPPLPRYATAVKVHRGLELKDLPPPSPRRSNSIAVLTCTTVAARSSTYPQSFWRPSPLSPPLPSLSLLALPLSDFNQASGGPNCLTTAP